MCVARHVQITYNKTFAFSLQYPKKEKNDKADFLHAGISKKTYYKLTLWFWWGWSSISKVPKIASLQDLYNMSKQTLEIKLTFCMQINIKVAYKLISTPWAPKFPKRWYYHYWWAWWSILKVLKVLSLQIFAISQKKKLGMEFIFCIQINIKKFLKVGIIIFDTNGDTCPKYPKQEDSYIFVIYCNCTWVLLWCKTFRCFMGVQPCLLFLVFGCLWSKMGAVFWTMTLKSATYR